MRPRIGLIDYGMGNLHSVQHAFKRLHRALELVRKPKDLFQCEALVLPGVGAFDPAMQRLEQSGLVAVLKTWAESGKPLLGICLGLQLLFESSDEGQSAGLGLLKGQVRRLPDDQSERIPHMGWAPLVPCQPSPLLGQHTQESWVYFVHSYAAEPSDPNVLAAVAPFGKKSVTALVWKDRLGACQFHPEKSAVAGHQILDRWLNWLDAGAAPLR